MEIEKHGRAEKKCVPQVSLEGEEEGKREGREKEERKKRRKREER